MHSCLSSEQTPPRNLAPNTFSATPFPNALSVPTRSMTKRLFTRHQADIPRYVPVDLQHSKIVPLGTSTPNRLIRNAFCNRLNKSENVLPGLLAPSVPNNDTPKRVETSQNKVSQDRDSFDLLRCSGFVDTPVACSLSLSLSLSL